MRTPKGISAVVLKFGREIVKANVTVTHDSENAYVVRVNHNNIGLIWRYPDVAFSKKARYWKTSMNGEKYKTRREAIRHLVELQIAWDIYFAPKPKEIYTFTYKAIGGEGICNRKVWKDGDKYIVLFSELPENKGTSVINWFEHLATDFVNEKNIPVKNVKFFQYDYHEPDDYSLVIMGWDSEGKKFTDASFTYNNKEAFEMLTKR